ncbi:LAFE_0E07536g1_1 [Lachancea fermentati]|uniref:LAFE_0E07536g1_1 n=1 Tax=Lachancea fermentati TaxID=4955 RepID=A0A1G4MDD3_LACFM|nr:LAFE_0E07536g1_1 [Lachancea fermentati]
MQRKRSIDQPISDAQLSHEDSEGSYGVVNPRKKQRQLAPMTQNNPTLSINAGKAGLPPPGYIKKVILKNFMCHEHFELELGPRLNFIVGNNGSGKSAVLTAITIGLGAKATDTNRGSSLKDLIREGCHSSRIVIILDNSGQGSFEQSTYGDEIIIERTIKKEGSSSFSIKSEALKEVSTKKRDLQAVVDHFAVPVMNPMCFLSQDAARSFLTASTPSEKYKHFMRGTLLEDTEENLNRALEIAINAQENLEFHAENVKALRQDYEDARRLVKEINANQDLNKRKRILQGKILWLNVKENEESRDKLRSNEAHYDHRIKEIDAKLEAKKNTIERFNADQIAMEEQLDSKLNEWQEKKAVADAAREAMHQVKIDFEVQKKHKDETEQHIKEAQDKVGHFKKTIEVLQDQLRKQMGGDKEKMQMEADAIRKNIDEANHGYSEANIRLRELKDKERTLVSSQKQALEVQQRSIHSKINELRELSRGKNNFLSNFDSNMERVLKVINQRRSEFSTIPIGPLGAYVTVKKGFENWARPIQRYFGGTLGAFVVANARDNRLLKEVFRACQIKTNANVITYTLSEFDYSRGKAQSQYPTISDALEFTSRSVECLFVDQNRIEKVVLIDDKDDARTTLQKKLPNITMALSLRDSKSGFQSSLSPYGGFRIDTIEYQDKLRMKLSSSSGDDSSYLKHVIKEEQADMARMRDHYEVLLQDVRTQMKTANENITQLKLKTSELSRREAALRLDMEKEVDTGLLEQAKIDKENYENAVVSYTIAAEEIQQKLEKISQQAQPLKQRFDETKTASKAAETTLNELKNSISSRSSKLEKLQDDIKHYTGKQDQYKQKREDLQQRVQLFENGIQKQIENAEVFCTRDSAFTADIPNSIDDIKREMERITRQIQLAERRVGMSQEQIVHFFEEAKVKYREAEKKYEEIDKAIAMINDSLKRRWQSLNYAKTDTCITADTDFKESLRFRNFSGGLHFDFGKGTLNMLIKTSNDEQARNVDTLSGGEKSFSQISLLLATWRPMRSRIIALDEFDVFMDQVNRQIGTKLIMNKLSKESRTQTIIITPQDIGKIANFNDPGIRIHKMKDPQRQNNSNFYSN